MSDTLRPHEPQHARPPCPSPTPGVNPNPCPSSRWCHPATSSSVVPFSSCPQSFPALGSFSMSQFFPWGGQSIGVSASTSVLPMNTQDWSPLGWTGWIFLHTDDQKNTWKGVQPCLLLENAKSEPQWGITSQWSEWSSFKKSINNKCWRKWIPLGTIGDNANWYNHCGNSFKS